MISSQHWLSTKYTINNRGRNHHNLRIFPIFYTKQTTRQGQSAGIYAQPKHLSRVSSLRNANSSEYFQSGYFRLSVLKYPPFVYVFIVYVLASIKARTNQNSLLPESTLHLHSLSPPHSSIRIRILTLVCAHFTTMQ